MTAMNILTATTCVEWLENGAKAYRKRVNEMFDKFKTSGMLNSCFPQAKSVFQNGTEYRLAGAGGAKKFRKAIKGIWTWKAPENTSGSRAIGISTLKFCMLKRGLNH